ncbi:MAG: Methionyl-tRNA formyltransferase [Patescibacteria group bacterium]|nr:Methionyl-tRNA formyltransferase [Patescibacteria group bacterium]
MGTSGFAAKIFEALLSANYNVISAYTRPDKKAGRKQEIQKTDVKKAAEEKNIPVYEPEKLDESVIAEIRAQKPDIIIVAAYGKILPKEILTIPGFGCINVHTSLLPKYRGPSPIQNAILRGEVETGSTIMLMDEGVDTGSILSQRKTAIDPDETCADLSRRLSELSASLLLETIPLWVERKITPETQNDAEATLCELIEKNDGKIIWTDSAKDIYNRYRAFSSWPGVFTYFESGKLNLRLKLNKISFAKDIPEEKHHLGEVVQIGEKIGIQAEEGVIILEEVQLEGKSNMNIADFINGCPEFIGSILK